MKRVNLRSAREGHRQKEKAPQITTVQPEIYVGQDVIYPDEAQSTPTPRPPLDPWYVHPMEGVNALRVHFNEHPPAQATHDTASRMLTFCQENFELADMIGLDTMQVTFLFAPYNDRAMPVQRMLGWSLNEGPYVWEGLEEARIAAVWLLGDGRHFRGVVDRKRFFSQLEITNDGSTSPGCIGALEMWSFVGDNPQPVLMRMLMNPTRTEQAMPDLYRTYLTKKPFEPRLFFIPGSLVRAFQSIGWHGLNALLVMWNPAWAVRRFKARRAQHDQRRAQEVRFEKTGREDVYHDNTLDQYLSIAKWPG
jgi:hypothetical protein